MSGRLSPSCSDQSQLFPLFFKNFLDSQCSVTLLAFWLFVVYKSAEWNKQRCMNLHVSAKMHAQVKTKVKLGIKMDGEGNEGKLELMSCYLSECCSCQDRRHLWPFYSCLRVGWFNFCPPCVSALQAGQKKVDLSALQTPQERFRVCASRWYFFSSRHQTEGLTACFAGRNAFYCALLCVYCTFMWCIVCLVL